MLANRNVAWLSPEKLHPAVDGVRFRVLHPTWNLVKKNRRG